MRAKSFQILGMPFHIPPPPNPQPGFSFLTPVTLLSTTVGSSYDSRLYNEQIYFTSSSTAFLWLFRAAQAGSCYGPFMADRAAAAYAWRALSALAGIPHPNLGLQVI